MKDDFDFSSIDEVIKDYPPKRRGISKVILIPLLVALITAIGAIVASLVQEHYLDEGYRNAMADVAPTLEFLSTKAVAPQLCPDTAKSPQLTAVAQIQPTITFLEGEAERQKTNSQCVTQVVPTASASVNKSRLEGMLTDRSGTPIGGITIAIENGPAAKTDSRGLFVINDIEPGDRVLVVKSSSGQGQLSQNIRIETGLENKVSIIYDASADMIGLLSISAPSNGEVIGIAQGQPKRITVVGRCDGLDQLFGGPTHYEIYVLVRSENDSRLWVQHPSAVIDHINNTWQATAILGSQNVPPNDKENWIIYAISADAGSGLNRIANAESEVYLPPHISSNVVAAITELQ